MLKCERSYIVCPVLITRIWLGGHATQERKKAAQQQILVQMSQRDAVRVREKDALAESRRYHISLSLQTPVNAVIADPFAWGWGRC